MEPAGESRCNPGVHRLCLVALVLVFVACTTSIATPTGLPGDSSRWRPSSWGSGRTRRVRVRERRVVGRTLASRTRPSDERQREPPGRDLHEVPVGPSRQRTPSHHRSPNRRRGASASGAALGLRLDRLPAFDTRLPDRGMLGGNRQGWRARQPDVRDQGHSVGLVPDLHPYAHRGTLSDSTAGVQRHFTSVVPREVDEEGPFGRSRWSGAKNQFGSSSSSVRARTPFPETPMVESTLDRQSVKSGRRPGSPLRRVRSCTAGVAVLLPNTNVPPVRLPLFGSERGGGGGEGNTVRTRRRRSGYLGERS